MTRVWIPSHIDLKIAAQLKSHESKPAAKVAPFITISRAFGCDGMDLAQNLLDRLNERDQGWYLFRRRMLFSEEGVQLSEERLKQLDSFGHSEMQGYIREALGMPNQRETVEQLVKIVFLLAKAGKVIFLGAGAALLTRKLQHGIHVRLNASLDWRVDNHSKRWQEHTEDPYKLVQDQSRDRDSFIKTYLGQDICSFEHYDMVFNNEKVHANHAAKLTLELMKARGLL